MSTFNNKDFQKGYATSTYSSFLNKFRYSKSKILNKSFIAEVSSKRDPVKEQDPFYLTSSGRLFSYVEASEIIAQIFHLSERIKSSLDKLESLLKKHDPYGQMILVIDNSNRKKLDKKIIYDHGRTFFAGRELFFITDLCLWRIVLAFEPSTFVISQEIEEKETEDRISIRKNMELNQIDKSKKVLMIDFQL